MNALIHLAELTQLLLLQSLQQSTLFGLVIYTFVS